MSDPTVENMVRDLAADLRSPARRRVAIAALRRAIAAETVLRRCAAAAGLPDAADGCRTVIAIVRQALGEEMSK